MTGHLLSELGDECYQCACGERFASALAALDHVMPLNTRDLADKIAADPKSTPDLIARSEATAQESARIARGDLS